MKILVISPYRGIGDLIFHLPLFRYLNKKFNTKINIITVHNSKAKYILQKEKIISKIIYADFNRDRIIKKIVNLTKTINKFKADIAILTAPSKRLRASLIISNAKEKVYFSKLNKKDLSKYILKETKKKFKLPKLEKNYQLNFKRVSSKINRKKVFINIDSFHNSNNWITEYYYKIILNLKKRKYKLFINFAPKNKKYFKEILKKLKKQPNIFFTYKNSFNEILKIINNCEFVIGSESGPICIAASFKKKILSIYNPLTTNKSSGTIYNKVKFINSKSVKPNAAMHRFIKFVK